MPQEKEKVESTTVQTTAADELRSFVNALPRTDGMTLPAIMINKIDDETLERMNTISRIHRAENDDTVVNEAGQTVAQIRNLNEYGVASMDAELPEGTGKHTVEVTDGGVTITDPYKDISDVVVLKETLPNISPMDAGAPTNPVEEKEAMGLKEDAPVAEVERARRSVAPTEGSIPPPAPSATTEINPQPFAQPVKEQTTNDESK